MAKRPVLDFSPFKSLGQSLGTDGALWNGVYTPFISDGIVKIPLNQIAFNTLATISAHGLMSMEDKAKLADVVKTLHEDVLPVLALLLNQNRVVGAITIYIRTAGNDSTGDGTSANPVATSAGAIALLSSKYPDSFLVSVTLNYGAGTFVFPVLSNVIFEGTAVSIVGQGSTTVFSSTANIGISSIYAGYLTITGVAFTRTGGFTGAIVQIYGMRATLTNVTFDTESAYATAFIARQGSVVLITGTFTFNAPSTTSFSTVVWATEGGTVVVNTSNFSINSKAGAYALKADGAGRICLRQELTAPVVNYTDSKEIRLQAVSGGMIAGPSAAAVAAFVGSSGTAIVDNWSQIFGVSA